MESLLQTLLLSIHGIAIILIFNTVYMVDWADVALLSKFSEIFQ